MFVGFFDLRLCSGSILLSHKRAGIPKKDRGAYSHEIRYAFAGTGETYAAPVDGSGNALTGGT